ncbi:phage minor head protein [Curtobacterium sp. MCSS17_007]|uniref:phage minor head protein n=1 Tax=Curtobacterium sp. MCSS17_007 TaxID=2175646 RepID=UPI0011B59CC7|nr:phage minor head protein [Curtobacterium sp. MCSS17_007]WIE74493.1 phage minor head protein [Curtobacterium sp. MCSS17_007]
MASRDEILRTAEELHVEIRATEEWQDSYKQSEDTFRALLELEAMMQTAMGEYLLELGTRAAGYVDWTRLPQPISADSGPVFNNDDPAWAREEQLLTAAVLDIIVSLIATGALAGEFIYEIPAGFSTLDEAVLEAARLHVATFVKGATVTTRKLIREAVAQSISLGEDATLAKQRLFKIINNPVRAELIAQTEPVNAYQTGYKLYAKATGAKKKTWDGLAGACALCTPLIGKTIDIDDLFMMSNGVEIDRPAAHPRCRCSLIYVY